MKWKITRQILMMSKYAIIGMIIQSIACSMLFAEEAFSQKSIEEIYISIHQKEKTVVQVFEKIERKTGFKFAYKPEILNDIEKISIDFEHASLADVLREISKSTQLRFRRVNQTLNVREPKNEIVPVQEVISVQQVKISGKVTSLEDNEPLPGVSILIKGTAKGTTTDIDGNYSISAPEGSILQYSYIGFLTQEITVGATTVVNISLESDLEQLEEVVVIGYGTVKKSDLTGSVANVKGKALENLPAPRVDQLLAGRMSGVQVTTNSGEPGASSRIRVRGGNSIVGNNEPLYVVDGYIAGQGFDLNTINVNDIQSIEVLKDASSIAIYGTRGANGVILITTKSGKGVGGGAPKVSVNYYQGWQSAINEIDFMDGNQYREFKEMAGDTFFADFNGNTNWFEEVSQVAQTNNLDLSLSGGNDNSSYYVSANYYNQEGIIKNSGMDRYSLRTNLDFTINDKVKWGTRTNLSHQFRDRSPLGMSEINAALPVFEVFDENGDFTSVELPSTSLFNNPVSRLEGSIWESSITDILSNIYLEITPVEGLVIRSTVAPRLVWNRTDRFLSSDITNVIEPSAQISTLFTTEILQENTISYTPNLGESHSLNLLAGFTWQTSDTRSTGMSGNSLTTNQLSFHGINTAPPEFRGISSAHPDPFQLVSWLGRANYSYKDKYLVTLTGRVDGSSRFASSNDPYAFFPAAAVAWNLKKEAFLENASAVSTMKLRASYGSSGNQSIPSFAALAVYGGFGPASFNEVASPSFRPSQPANPDLRWETTDQLDIGLELGLFNERLNIEVDVYQKITNDLLAPVRIAAQSGFNNQVLQNVGSIENEGIDLAISGVILEGQDIQWNSTLTFSVNRGKVTSLPDAIDTLALTDFVGANFLSGGITVAIEGEVPGSFMGLPYLGVWNSQAEIDEAGASAVPGDPRFQDLNGDGIYTFEEDYQIIGNNQPDFIWGWQNTINYKNWSLDFLLQGVQGNDVFNIQSAYSFFNLGNGERPLYPELLNAWTPENTNTNVPRAGFQQAGIDPNTELIEDGSHIRMRNVRLGYTFAPQQDTWFKSVNVYAAATNLFLITADGFRGIDPESNSNINRSGNFNQVNSGLIFNSFPSARTITLGVNATF